MTGIFWPALYVSDKELELALFSLFLGESCALTNATLCCLCFFSISKTRMKFEVKVYPKIDPPPLLLKSIFTNMQFQPLKVKNWCFSAPSIVTVTKPYQANPKSLFMLHKLYTLFGLMKRLVATKLDLTIHMIWGAYSIELFVLVDFFMLLILLLSIWSISFCNVACKKHLFERANDISRLIYMNRGLIGSPKIGLKYPHNWIPWCLLHVFVGHTVDALLMAHLV